MTAPPITAPASLEPVPYTAHTHRVLLAADLALPFWRASERRTFIVRWLTVGAAREDAAGGGDVIPLDGDRVVVLSRSRARDIALVAAHLDDVEPGAGWNGERFPVGGPLAARVEYVAGLDAAEVRELAEILRAQVRPGATEAALLYEDAHIGIARAMTGGAKSDFYDCAKCEREPWRKLDLGHDGPPRQFWRENLVTEATLPECPLRTLLRMEERDPNALREMVAVRDHYAPAYRRGHLPTGGSVDEQPARLMAYIDLAERIALEMDVAMKAARERDGIA